MNAPDFWWQPERRLPALALAPAAWLVGEAAAWRMARPPGYRPPVPVICIGNFVVGGAGKTPTALAVARIARERGLKPGFVASGYGGTATAPLLVDAVTTPARLAGDEPLVLAALAPTVAGGDRAAAARLLVDSGKVDLVIMDDGFQNPHVAKDLSLVVVDAGAGIGNGHVMPAGPVRAPLGVQLRRADALVIVGEDPRAEPIVRLAARAAKPILRARLKPVRPDGWQGRPIFAFAGIGRPAKFYASLTAIGAPVARTADFPDHHPYTEEEARRLIAHAEAADLRLVTTEKDMARLAGAGGALAELRERAEAFAVMLAFENPAAVSEMIGDVVRKSLARPASPANATA